MVMLLIYIWADGTTILSFYMSRDHDVYTQDLEDRDDERPQVVQLSHNDLTAEEAKKHWDEEEQSGKKTGGDEDIKGETSIVIDCKLSDYVKLNITLWHYLKIRPSN